MAAHAASHLQSVDTLSQLARAVYEVGFSSHLGLIVAFSTDSPRLLNRGILSQSVLPGVGLYNWFVGQYWDRLINHGTIVPFALVHLMRRG